MCSEFWTMMFNGYQDCSLLWARNIVQSSYVILCQWLLFIGVMSGKVYNYKSSDYCTAAAWPAAAACFSLLLSPHASTHFADVLNFPIAPNSVLSNFSMVINRWYYLRSKILLPLFHNVRSFSKLNYLTKTSSIMEQRL